MTKKPLPANEIAQAIGTLGFTVDRCFAPAHGQEMFLGITPNANLTPAQYIEAGRQLFEFELGKQWVFGDLIRHAERRDLAEHLAPVANYSIKSLLNQASVAESYTGIATPAMLDRAELARLMDNIAQGKYWTEKGHFGALRTPLLKWSMYQKMQGWGNGLIDFRAETLIQATRENWNVSDLTTYRDSLLETLATTGHASAQKLANRRKIFGVAKIKWFEIVINPNASRVEMFKQFSQLINELQALGRNTNEVKIVGRYSYDKKTD